MHPHPHNTTETWQIVTDAFGYDSIHETTEDGRPGDLIAHSFGDHSALLRAAPELRDALQNLVRACDRRALFGAKHVPSMRDEQNARATAHTALTKASGL